MGKRAQIVPKVGRWRALLDDEAVARRGLADMAGDLKSALQLYEIAEAQAGYFTPKQAGAAGYSRQLLSHHAHAGNIKRVQHGIYRLTRFPHSPGEDPYIAWLRCGPHTVISHDSALELYG